MTEPSRLRTSHPAAPTATGGSSDPRVYLDQVSGHWRYEDEQGNEWEWQSVSRTARPIDSTQEQDEDDEKADLPSASSGPNSSLKGAPAPEGYWVSVLDEDLVTAQQQAYSVAGVDESAPVPRRTKKRAATSTPTAGQSSSSSSAKIPPSKRARPVTSLYVTGLPLDSTLDEIASVFSRYGLLLEDDEGKPRIKLYHDEKTDMFRGEALIVYFKPESVTLAINMLDETNLRAAIGHTSGPTMRVQRAEFPTSQEKPASQTSAATTTVLKSTNGTSVNAQAKEAVASTQGSKRNLTDQERKKIQRRVARMEDKLADWRDSDSEAEDEALRRAEHVQGRSNISAQAVQGRTVVLTKMFTLFELDQDPTLLLDLKEEVRDECTSTIGPVSSVTLWDKEPEGIMTVKFTTSEHAHRCVDKMKGRFFAARTIDAFVINSKPRFRKSVAHENDPNNDNDDEDADETTQAQKRQDQFGAWLQNE